MLRVKRIVEVVFVFSMACWLLLILMTGIASRVAAEDPVDRGISQRVAALEAQVKQHERDYDKHEKEFLDTRKSYDTHIAATNTRLTIIETTLHTNSQVLYALALAIIIALMTRGIGLLLNGFGSYRKKNPHSVKDSHE